jgi:hypothetical protein
MMTMMPDATSADTGNDRGRLARRCPVCVKVCMLERTSADTGNPSLRNNPQTRLCASG